MLITPAYLQTQQQLHEDRPDYGSASVTYAPLVSKFVNQWQVQHLLDYGCGKGRLFKCLEADHPMTLQAYDPAIERFSARPMPAEMVTCIDVLEHIEPDLIDDVLDDLDSLTEMIGFFTVATVAAHKTLSDGRNAHLIIEPAAWWLPKIQARFELQMFQKNDDGFWVVVTNSPPLQIAKSLD